MKTKMKLILILLAVIIIAFFIVQLFAMKGQRNIETYPYLVKKKYEIFEIRDYEATLFTSVKLSAKAYSEASSKGFSILAGYIFGKNERSEKISMTSPVAMSLEDSVTMMFMVPKKLKKEMKSRDIASIFEDGLHEFISDFIGKNNALGLQIETDFRFNK